MNREDFPMLEKDFIYFNNASTAYKPKCVIDKMNEFYNNYSVNINRGIDSLGYMVTNMYEDTRKLVAQFLNAKPNEIIFTRGTTDSLNIIANSLAEFINEEDEIITSIHEHHANFISWQQLCFKKNAKLVIVKTNSDGTVDLEDLKEKMNEKVKIVALNHTSNVYGSTNNIKEISKIVHEYNAYLVIDGAQGIVHNRVDVSDVDFYAFSGHKLYGPFGVGVLYGKYEILKKMKPTTFGGEMIDIVTIDKTTFKEPPYCFEAGTMMIPEVLGLGEAIKYLLGIGYDKINNHINSLRNYLLNRLMNEISDIEIYNKNVFESSVIAFNIKGIHAHDVASFLDKEKIIVRAGHHCAAPLMDYLKTPSTVRISLGLYNTKEECDKLVEVLKKVGDYINVLF